MLLEPIQSHSFCIYGAGIVAASIYTAIETLYHKKPLFFLISDFESRGGRFGKVENQATEIDGIAVKTLSEWDMQLHKNNRRKDCEPDIYLIAVPEIHHPVIIESLCSLASIQIKDTQIIPVTNELENELMERYCHSLPDGVTVHSLLSGEKREQENRQPAYDRKGNEAQSIQVFQVKSHADKPLHHEHPFQVQESAAYICPIQAGAALTNQIVADLQDDTGENISAKNRNYCELTATYHAWKNCHAAYKGICHYRRIFAIDDKQMQALLEMEHKWDVILPYPSVYYPNIAKEHTRYVSESDWNAMLRALRETAPEYLAAYEKAITNGEQFFYNFNMLIAKSAVFDDYCNFLFTVLERTEELTTPKGWERADRFAGYLGENLTTIYFLKNRERLKLVHAGKIWLT